MRVYIQAPSFPPPPNRGAFFLFSGVAISHIGLATIETRARPSTNQKKQSIWENRSSYIQGGTASSKFGFLFLGVLFVWPLPRHRSPLFLLIRHNCLFICFILLVSAHRIATLRWVSPEQSSCV